MLGNGKGSSWRHCRKGAELRDVTCHATWSCLLSVGNALSTAYLFHILAARWSPLSCVNISTGLLWFFQGLKLKLVFQSNKQYPLKQKTYM